MKLIARKKKIQKISLKLHNRRKNKICILRTCGGFGDILMQRMIFEDLQNQFPHLEFTFCCPSQYLDAMKNHPYIKPISMLELKEDDYGLIINISQSCGIHESKYGINNKEHRSDIWAATIGIGLKNHNMHLTVENPDSIEIPCKGQKIALIAVESLKENFNISKNLKPELVVLLVDELRKQGFFVCSIHNEINTILSELKVYQYVNLTMEQWISLVAKADFVVSIDTATFHMAGGLKKPLMGIFSFTNGKVYGKYYDFVLVQKHFEDENWPCGPCYNLFLCPHESGFPKPCMTKLTPDYIKKGLARCLEKWPQLIQDKLDTSL